MIVMSLFFFRWIFVPLPQDFWALDKMSKLVVTSGPTTVFFFPLSPKHSHHPAPQVCVPGLWMSAVFDLALDFLLSLSLSLSFSPLPCLAAPSVGGVVAALLFVLWSHLDVSTVTVAISSGLDFHLGLLCNFIIISKHVMLNINKNEYIQVQHVAFVSAVLCMPGSFLFLDVSFGCISLSKKNFAVGPLSLRNQSCMLSVCVFLLIHD